MGRKAEDYKGTPGEGGTVPYVGGKPLTLFDRELPLTVDQTNGMTWSSQDNYDIYIYNIKTLR